MNIQRVTTELATGPVSKAGQSRFDITITDQGARATEPSNTVVQHVASPPSNSSNQITSSADLQAVLSSQESEALARSFAFLDRADAGTDGRLTLYNGRGSSAALENGQQAGSLLDVMG